MIIDMEHVGGLSEVVPACDLAVCLAHAWKALSLESAAALASYSVGRPCVKRYQDFSVLLRVSGGCQCAYLCPQLVQPCPETQRK